MKSILLSLTFLSSLVIAQQQDVFNTQITTVNEYRVLNGEIEAVNKGTVSSQTAGRVAKLHYDVDDIVQKDSILVEFTNTEQKSRLNQAQENAKAAKIAYEQAQTDYLRVKDIFEKKLIAKSQLDQALSNRDALKAKSAAAQAAVTEAEKQFEYTVIRAPYDGIVTNRYVELGEAVNPGTPIMEGLSLDKLRVITEIPETIINNVKNNPSATIVLNDEKEVTTDRITIFPYADKSTRTFKVRLELDSKNTQLFPGMSVKVKFKTGEKSALLIPESALVKRSELTMVYIKSDNGSVIPRQVKTGTAHDNQIEVISGISENENILLAPLGK